ncbi:serpin-Z2B-like [Silene latifolia]|uniref:serpin-Z2B-like n=1 Tax=Silene latifolia TaxID=37657 RepID=UPI003D783103
MASMVMEKNKRSINLKVALTEANKSVSSNENFICSPLGIHILLSILANGSTGETRNQIYKYLGSKTLKEINQTASEIMEVVSPKIDASPAGPKVSFVNGSWVNQQNTSLRPAFQKLLQTTYKADAKAVDFKKKEEVCKEINSWVSEATRGVITEILSPEVLEQDTILVLGNALFFKAAWKTRFTRRDNKLFRLITGEHVRAPFMSTSFRGYYEYEFQGGCFDDFNFVRFPYKTGQDTTRQFAMYIFLPNSNDGLLGLLLRFSKDSGFLDKHIELSDVVLYDLWIPKFKFSYTFSVKDTLMQLGLDRMFLNVGELNKIVKPPLSEQLYVSKILQRSFVEVNEEGTLAASVMLSQIGGGPPPPNQFSFVADDPFLFTIREETSQVTLFVGTVLNPLLE